MVQEKEYVVNTISSEYHYIKIKLFDSGGKPFKNMPYKLETKDKTYEGNSDDEGLIEHKIPNNVSEGTLIFGEEKVKILFDAFADIEDLKGVQQRLNNLGFDCGTPDGEMSSETIEALQMFQEIYDLEVTGEATRETKDKLLEIVGR